MDSFDTIPALLRHVAASYHHASAFNLRQDGAWTHTSTESFVKHVRRMALGLQAMGLKRGQSVGILAESSPWWLMADLAILIAGGVSVPLFTTSSPANLKYKIRHADIRLTFVCGDTAAERFRRCRRLFSKAIIRSDGTSNGSFITDRRLMEMGDERSVKDPALFQRLIDQVKPDDVATIIYTSGTSGRPKGVVLTHRNIVSQIHASGQWFEFDCAKDRGLSILPLAHAFERMVTYFCVSRGVSLWFADPSNDLPQAITEVQPTAIAVVPRVLEKIYGSMISKVEAAGLLGKPLGRWAIRLAHTRNGKGQSRSLGDRVAESLVYAKMRQALGGHLKTVICGGAPLSPRLCRFFLNIGVPVYQGYGLTEASPVITANHPGHNRVGTVGQALPGVEVTIGEHDEVLARGPNIMVGYHRDPQTTAQTIDGDGWLHTGDQGRLDDEGYLTITGRIKDLCKTAGGKYVSPAPIEKSLTASPLIDQACVVADDRPFASCLIFPDIAHLRRILATEDARQLHDDELFHLPEVKEQIEHVLTKVNEGLEPWEQIHRYRLIADTLSVDDGSLTPTQKLRRRELADRYRDLIDSMYSNEPDQDESQQANDHNNNVGNVGRDGAGRTNGDGRGVHVDAHQGKESYEKANRDH